MHGGWEDTMSDCQWNDREEKEKLQMEKTLEDFERLMTLSTEPSKSNQNEAITGPLLPSQIGHECWRAPQTPVPKVEQEKARAEMVLLLESRLNAKCNKTNGDDTQISKTARALEHLLFRQAKDLRAYKDASTLDGRLRGLMTILVRRKMMGGNSSRKTYDRTRLLIQILGPQRFKHCKDLVQKVKRARTNKVAKLKCNNVVCGRTFDQQLPPVVRMLYFETFLIDAFEKYPINKLPNLDWNMLIDQAELTLRDFELWETEHDPPKELNEAMNEAMHQFENIR